MRCRDIILGYRPCVIFSENMRFNLTKSFSDREIPDVHLIARITLKRYMSANHLQDELHVRRSCDSGNYVAHYRTRSTSAPVNVSSSPTTARLSQVHKCYSGYSILCIHLMAEFTKIAFIASQFGYFHL
jgi:hypothetical protein